MTKGMADGSRGLNPRGPVAGALLAAALAAAVALVSAAPRIALAAGALPDAARPLLWADMLDTYDYLAGRAPYWEAPFYYPPLVGYLIGALVKLTATSAAFVLVWAALVSVGAGAVGAVLARAAGARGAIVSWAATPQLVLFAGVNFDALALVFVVAAVQLARARRAIPALAMLATGTCVKAFPAVLAPVQLDALRSDLRRFVAATAAFAGIVVVVTLPSLLAPWPITFTVPDYARKVTSESVWGLIQAVLTVFSAGTMVGPITVVGLLATYALGVMPAARRARDPAVGAGLAIVTVLLWSRIYQPQYSLWIVPFFALARIPSRWYALLTVGDISVFATLMVIQAVSAGPPPEPLLGVLTAALTLRHAALVGIWIALYRTASKTE